MVKNTDCSSTGPGFCFVLFPSTHDNLQLSVTPVPGDLTPSHRHAYYQNSNIHKIFFKERKRERKKEERKRREEKREEKRREEKRREEKRREERREKKQKLALSTWRERRRKWGERGKGARDRARTRRQKQEREKGEQPLL